MIFLSRYCIIKEKTCIFTKKGEKILAMKLQGTEFCFSVLPPNGDWDGFSVKTKLVIKNDVIHYEEIGERLSLAEAEELTCLIARLLAGAFSKEYSFTAEKPSSVVVMRTM